VHTCDKRNTKSYIAKSHPSFTIEEGFTEADELWNPTVRETKAEVSIRARSVIDKIFREDPEATCKSNFPLFTGVNYNSRSYFDNRARGFYQRLFGCCGTPTVFFAYWRWVFDIDSTMKT